MNAAQPAPFSAVPHAPRSDDPGALLALAADLSAADYRHDAVEAALGHTAMGALMREQPVPARRAVRGLEESGRQLPLATLVRLFLLGGSTKPERVALALPTLGAEGARALGLLEADPADPRLWRAAVDLRPHASDADAEVWVSSDIGAAHRPGVLRKDHVLGIGRASLTLAAATIRRPAARALDLGVGCGIQTFHLLAHCDHVTATDLSERALAFTRFNLLLNAPALGIDPANLEARVSLRQGSLLEPVEGERFDLVVSNPPFVITPRRSGESEEDRFTYRDGGLPGDQLVASLWAGLPGVLAVGGTAQMLANWEIPSALLLPDAGGKDPATGAPVPGWAQRLAGWTPEGIEAWVIQRDVEDPAGYAETWLRDASEIRSPQAADRSYEAYLDDFASRDVGAVGLGLVWMRRPAPGATAGVGRRFESIDNAIDAPLGPVLQQAIFRADALAAVDVSLVHAVAAEDVTVETHSGPGEPHPQAILLRQGGGLRRVTLLDTATAGLVSACDGELALGSIANAVVALLEASGDEGGVQAPALLEEAARLIRDGYLRFPHPGE